MTSPALIEAHTAWSCAANDVGIMDGHICYVSVDDGAKEIARVRLDRDRAVEGARLIAAAPELLDALKRLLNDDCPNRQYVLGHPAADLARAVIAKALGQ